MAHFTITLPDNITGDVRHGKVFKKHTAFTKNFPWIKIHSEERKGYIVMIATAADIKQYILTKTTANEWLSNEQDELKLAIRKDKRWLAIDDDQTTIAIKKAIDDYENKQ